MPKVTVQFSDETGATIVSYFGCPQGDWISNQAEIDVSDPRWATYYASLPGEIRETLPSPN
jgi:hypothetical protein